MQRGATVHLHIVTAEADVRWKRVQERNGGQSATFALAVTEDTFVGSEAWWEPPSDTEFTGPVTFHNVESSR